MKAEGKRYPSQIVPSAVERFLGPPQFFNLEAERRNEVGVATAIAWTENGGEIMPVEVLIMEGKGNLQITGQVGNVMQESAQAALSFIKSRSAQLNINNEIFEQVDIHIHIPEGAIPKDGPSAGITICTALYSAFSGREVQRDVGMTGEITLRGRIIPVGGVREKVLAAHRAGLKTVILPKRNRKDLVDVPKRARNELNIIPVEHMDQVLEFALVPLSDKIKLAQSKRRSLQVKSTDLKRNERVDHLLPRSESDSKPVLPPR
jgi:ATP-dependent Lon protease